MEADSLERQKLSMDEAEIERERQHHALRLACKVAAVTACLGADEAIFFEEQAAEAAQYAKINWEAMEEIRRQEEHAAMLAAQEDDDCQLIAVERTLSKRSQVLSALLLNCSDNGTATVRAGAGTHLFPLRPG